MQPSYYQQPSPLTIDILKFFDVPLDKTCIDAIEWAEVLHGFKFSDCQVLKYLWRLGVKTEDIKADCFKILDYIDRAIANESHVTKTLKIVELHVICLMKRNGIDEERM